MGELQRRTRTVDAPSTANDAPAAVVDVVLLTDDEKLLAILREASSRHHSLWHASSPSAAIELLVGGHCGILVADLALLSEDAANLLDRLQTQFPELIILATGRRDEEARVAAAISSGRIYRFLHKPVSPARASLFLGTATRRYGELREVESLALATVRQLASRPRFNRWGMGLAALAIAGSLCTWLALDRRPERVTEAAPLTSANDFLKRAQAAFTAGKLADSSDRNALALYRAALAAAPDSTEARDGITRVIAALDKQAVNALLAGKAASASIAINKLQQAHPAHPHLASLRQQLQALSAPLPKPAAAAPATTSTATVVAVAAPEPTPVPQAVMPVALAAKAARQPVPAPVSPQIDRARARMAASQLIAPVDDSAATYLRRARELGEDETLLKIAATDLGTRLIDQTRQALRSGDLAQSQSDYAAAVALDAEFELGLPELDSIGRQLSLAKQVSSAAAESAIAIPTQATVSSAVALRRVHEVAPVYPRQAELDGIEGWVDIDFYIDLDGSPQDLVVRAAQPRDVFEHAALDSLRQWRFEPVLRNGNPIVQPTTLRLQFLLKR